MSHRSYLPSFRIFLRTFSETPLQNFKKRENKIGFLGFQKCLLNPTLPNFQLISQIFFCQVIKGKIEKFFFQKYFFRILFEFFFGKISRKFFFQHFFINQEISRQNNLFMQIAFISDSI